MEGILSANNGGLIQTHWNHWLVKVSSKWCLIYEHKQFENAVSVWASQLVANCVRSGYIPT